MQNWTQWKNPNQVGGKTIWLDMAMDTKKNPLSWQNIELASYLYFSFQYFHQKKVWKHFLFGTLVKNPRCVVSFETIVGG